MSYFLFLEKKIYKENFPNLYKFNAKPIDMWQDRTHYGKIDLKQNIIHLSSDAEQTKLKQLRATNPGEELFLAVDFVAEAFNDFKMHFTKADVFGKISETGHIRELRQTNGLVPWSLEYEKYFSRISNTFIFKYVNQNPEINEKIVDFKSFMNEFMIFARNFSGMFPITKTGMIKSRFCSPHVTGLMIEVDLLNHDDNRDKYEWLEDINFNFYRNAARKFGFLVDKNAPWRLVADIASIPLQRYWQKSRILKQSNTSVSTEDAPIRDDCWDFTSQESVNYYKWWQGLTKAGWVTATADDWTKREEIDVYGNKKITEIKGAKFEDYMYPTSVPHFLDEYYEKSHMTDLTHLKEKLLMMYNNLVTEFPVVNISRRKGCILESRYVTEKLVHKKIERKKTHSEKDDFKGYTDFQWLKIYMDLRILEEKVKLRPASYKNKLRQLKKIYKYIDQKNLDNGKSLCYINEQTKQLVYRPTLEKDITGATSQQAMGTSTGGTSVY